MTSAVTLIPNPSAVPNPIPNAESDPKRNPNPNPGHKPKGECKYNAWQIFHRRQAPDLHNGRLAGILSFFKTTRRSESEGDASLSYHQCPSIIAVGSLSVAAEIPG